MSLFAVFICRLFYSLVSLNLNQWLIHWVILGFFFLQHTLNGWEWASSFVMEWFDWELGQEFVNWVKPCPGSSTYTQFNVFVVPITNVVWFPYTQTLLFSLTHSMVPKSLIFIRNSELYSLSWDLGIQNSERISKKVYWILVRCFALFFLCAQHMLYICYTYAERVWLYVALKPRVVCLEWFINLI